MVKTNNIENKNLQNLVKMVNFEVVPAEAGIQGLLTEFFVKRRWMPVFTGMTKKYTVGNYRRLLWHWYPGTLSETSSHFRTV
jgi:hypothetical protein